jgi:HEAT repeat protein
MNNKDIRKLLEDCSSGISSKQVSAITKLRELKAYEAVSTLLPLLFSSEENVRGCVIETLGWLGEKEKETVGTALIKILDDPDELIRVETIDALARLKYISAIEKIKQILHDDSDWLVRSSAAEALADLSISGDLEVLAHLEMALDDPAQAVRSYAAMSIGILGISTPEFLEKLQVHISSEESLNTKAELLAARYRLGVQEDLLRFLELFSFADEHLTGILLNILEDLTERKTPESLIDKLSNIQEILVKVTQSFPIFCYQACLLYTSDAADEEL